MNSITDPRMIVNHAVSDSAITCTPNIAEFLRTNPLPHGLKHMTTVAAKFPSIDLLIETIAVTYLARLSKEETCNAMRTVVAYHERSEHRCTCCLGWTKAGSMCAAIKGGKFDLLTICPQCYKKIEDGRATATMAENMKAYGVGEVAR
jgi:hypothetical protein